MTLNELIKRLEEIRDEHGGELPVTVFLDYIEQPLTKPESITVKKAGDTNATNKTPDYERVVVEYWE